MLKIVKSLIRDYLRFNKGILSDFTTLGKFTIAPFALVMANLACLFMLPVIPIVYFCYCTNHYLTNRFPILKKEFFPNGLFMHKWPRR